MSEIRLSRILNTTCTHSAAVGQACRKRNLHRRAHRGDSEAHPCKSANTEQIYPRKSVLQEQSRTTTISECCRNTKQTTNMPARNTAARTSAVFRNRTQILSPIYAFIRVRPVPLFPRPIQSKCSVFSR